MLEPSKPEGVISVKTRLSTSILALALSVVLPAASTWCQESESVQKSNQTVQEQGIVPGHAYTVLGTVETEGKTYTLVRNPWGKAEPDESDNSVKQSRTTPMTVKRGSPAAENQTDHTASERALAYCKELEGKNEACGFTLATACPSAWSVGRSFEVGGKKYTACIKAQATAQ